MIRAETHGAVRLLFLARPAKRNAIDTVLATALIAALHDAAAAGGVRGIVLAGEGPGFSAGADLAEMRALADDAAGRAARALLSAELLATPGRLGKPVIAAVQGAALGAGAALAICCDQTVMSDEAVLGFPEAKHGMLAERMVPVLRRHLSPRRCLDLLATARSLDAGEALAWGLADAVVPQARLLGEAKRRAEAAALLPPDKLAALKALCGMTMETPR